MTEKNIKLVSPLTALSGVGEKRAELFETLGVFTVGDLLRHFPRLYQNRGDTSTLCEAALSGETSSVIMTVGSEPASATVKNRMNLTKFFAFDESGKCQIVFFNQPYVKKLFHIGEVYRFYGKVTRTKNSWSMSSPDFEPAFLGRSLPDFYPIYPLTAGLSQKIMRSVISLALDLLQESEFAETVPDSVREKNSLVSIKDALFGIHRPSSMREIENARKYFVFEELYDFALKVTKNAKKKEGLPGRVLEISNADKRAFVEKLPFKLTGAQARVIREIYADMASGKAMHRLLSGDVGSGKTLCAAASLYLAAKNGVQGALMAPTEILATQHYHDLCELFEPLGVKCTLLVGSMTKKEKNIALAGLQSGESAVAIGTHALISENVLFADLALAVIDEQHRFGIDQREALMRKGRDVHTLGMSATPIPRTLAMSIYGDLDHSALDELPPGRQKVSTFLVDESYRERLNGFVHKEALLGHKVYIVCPSIEGDGREIEADSEEYSGSFVDLFGNKIEKTPLIRLKNAVEYADRLSKAFPDIKIACLHGKMPSAEKERAMADFVSGDTAVLVSTTVIEVGVNVPTATLMVIENAERFGLSQLHQLRGRVGRGKDKSWCVLVSEAENELSKKRLTSLCETTDGYKVAEADLALRGPGDFLTAANDSLRQHGSLAFKMADLYSDVELLVKAFEAAKGNEGNG